MLEGIVWLHPPLCESPIVLDVLSLDPLLLDALTDDCELELEELLEDDELELLLLLLDDELLELEELEELELDDELLDELLLDDELLELEELELELLLLLETCDWLELLVDEHVFSVHDIYVNHCSVTE